VRKQEPDYELLRFKQIGPLRFRFGGMLDHARCCALYRDRYVTSAPEKMVAAGRLSLAQWISATLFIVLMTCTKGQYHWRQADIRMTTAVTDEGFL
jgi:hypothetical protein